MSPGVLPTVLTSSRDVFFGAPASPLLEGMRAPRSRALSTMCSAPIMSAWPAPPVTVGPDSLDSHLWRPVPPVVPLRPPMSAPTSPPPLEASSPRPVSPMVGHAPLPAAECAFVRELLGLYNSCRGLIQ